jgi:hypothetical protein
MRATELRREQGEERRERALRDVVRLLARQAAAEWVHENRRLQDESACR